VYAELRLDPILDAASATRRVADVPAQAAIDRDLAVVLPETTPAGDVTDAIREAAGAPLTGLHLFDVYAGAPLAADEKSLAFRLTLQVDEPGEADAVVGRVTRAVSERGWRLRA
jgi:phenylalanyl-tRNA synthetase beta chain